MMTWRDWFFERPRRHVFGWWSFDDAESMLLRDDGTRVRFLGPAADDTALDIRNTGNRRWMRFELRSDASTEPTVYPLLVERRDVLDPLTAAHRRLVWQLDQHRSAKLWGAQPPDHVLWQAVDRLAIDAMYCWPDGTRAGLRPAEVAVSGGWCGGEWTTDFDRGFSGSGIGAFPGEGRYADRTTRSIAVLGNDPSPTVWRRSQDAQAQFQALRSAAPHEVAALRSRADAEPSAPAVGRCPAPGAALGQVARPGQVAVALRWTTRSSPTVWVHGRRHPHPPLRPNGNSRSSLRQCLVGTINRRTGEFLDFARISPWYTDRIPQPGALFFEGRELLDAYARSLPRGRE